MLAELGEHSGAENDPGWLRSIPIAIAEHLDHNDAFDNAIADFPARYADQNQRDYDTFVEAIADGRIQAITGT
jgi:Uncharacterized protein conserved in bacteria (DUF2252)